MTPRFELAFFAHAVHRHGGQERAAREVLSRVADRGIPVTVVAGACDLGDPVRFIRVPRVGRPLMLTALAYQWRARRIERRLAASLTNSIGAAARDADVITAQFCHASYTRQFGGQRGSGLHGRAWQRAAQQVFTALERRAYGASRLRRVIAVSAGTARDIVEYYGVDSSKVHVVPNGVDLERFSPPGSGEVKAALRQRLGLPPERLLAVFVGGDWRRKGVGDAVRACAGLANVTLVVVGSGDIAAVMKLAKRESASVVCVGQTTEPESYCAAADVFLYPTRYETFGMGALEGAAAGLPVVSYRVHGVEDRVVDGVNGWVVPHLPEALRERLRSLEANTDMRLAMGVAARASALPYSWDNVAIQYFDVLAKAAQ